MRIIKPAIVLATLLTACAGETTIAGIGEKTTVHDYYSAMVTSYETKDSIQSKTSDGTIETYEKNNYKYVVIGVTMYGNNSDKANHVLDGNDFKLAIDRSTASLISRVKPIQDYSWIGQSISKNTEKGIVLSFEIATAKVSSYKYLEIDFINAPGNAFIRIINGE